MKESQKFELVFNSEIPYFNQINTAELKEIIYNEFLEQELIPCLKSYRLNFYSDDEWNEIVFKNLAEEKGRPLQLEFHRLAMRNELDDKFYIHNINKCPSIITLNQIKDNYDVFCNSFKKEQHQKVEVITQSISDLLESINKHFTEPIIKYIISENRNIPLNISEMTDSPLENFKEKKNNWKETKIELNVRLNQFIKDKKESTNNNKINPVEKKLDTEVVTKDENFQEVKNISYFDFFLNRDLRKVNHFIMTEDELKRFKKYISYYFLNDYSIYPNIEPIKAYTNDSVLIHSMKFFYKDYDSSKPYADNYFEMMKLIFTNLKDKKVDNIRKTKEPQYFKNYFK